VVVVWIYSSLQKEREFQKTNFERNKTDVFGVQAPDLGKHQKIIFGFKTVDLGENQKIRIGHDNSGFGVAWFLDKVIVTNEKTEQK